MHSGSHLLGDGAVNVRDHHFIVPVPKVDGGFTATCALILCGHTEHHLIGTIPQVQTLLQSKAQFKNAFSILVTQQSNHAIQSNACLFRTKSNKVQGVLVPKEIITVLFSYSMTNCTHHNVLCSQ